MRIPKLRAGLILAVLAGPLLDLMTGYFQDVIGSDALLTPGVLYRGVFLLPILIIMAFHSRTLVPFLLLYFLSTFAVSNLLYYLDGQVVDVVDGLNRLLKIIFPLIGFGALVYLQRRYPKKMDRRFVLVLASAYGLLVAISLVFFYYIGIYLPTYRHQSFSSKALFGAQNDTGIVLVLSLPLWLYYIHTYKRGNLFLLVGSEVLFLAGAAMLSTRAAIMGVVSTIILFHVFIIIKPRVKRSRLTRQLKGILLFMGIVALGLLLYRLWSAQDVDYTLRKFELLRQGDFRERVPDGIEEISRFDIVEHLFGVGETEFSLTENDLVDIYGKFGLAILVPILAFYTAIYLQLVWIFFRRRRLFTFLLLLGFSFYIGHASLAGHALASSQVNNLFMLLYFMAYLEIVAYRQWQRMPGDVHRNSWLVNESAYGTGTFGLDKSA